MSKKYPKHLIFGLYFNRVDLVFECRRIVFELEGFIVKSFFGRTQVTCVLPKGFDSESFPLKFKYFEYYFNYL